MLVVMMFMVFMMVMVVMLVLMIVTTAGAMLIMLVSMLMSLDQLSSHLVGQSMSLFHGFTDLSAGQAIPGSGDDGSLFIVTTQQLDTGFQLVLSDLLGAAQDDGIGGLYLVIEEFTKVFHVQFALGSVYDGNKTAQLYRHLSLYTLYSFDDIGQLAYTGGLEEDAVRSKLYQHFLQCLAKITYQRAADAAGIHLVELDAGVF